MPLSDDQKAILRLLAQRGEQGYEDLAALMSIDVAQVHERAQAAAAQLESEGIPAPQIPAPRGSTARPEPVEKKVTAPEPTPKPAAPSERAPSPDPASVPKPAPAFPPSTPSSAPQRPKLALPKNGGARAALAAGVAVVVALVIVLAVSGDDSDNGSSTASSESSTASESTADAASSDQKLTEAVLSPVDGGDAKGLATFGRVKNSLALQIEAEGLEPTAKGQSYTIWLYESAKKRLPLASTAVGANGKIGAQVQVPTEVLAYLAKETFDQLDVSLTSDATLKAALAKATKEKTEPLYTGTDVLRGTITGPIIGAASR